MKRVVPIAQCSLVADQGDDSENLEANLTHEDEAIGVVKNTIKPRPNHLFQQEFLENEAHFDDDRADTRRVIQESSVKSRNIYPARPPTQVSPEQVIYLKNRLSGLGVADRRPAPPPAPLPKPVPDTLADDVSPVISRCGELAQSSRNGLGTLVEANICTLVGDRGGDDKA